MLFSVLGGTGEFLEHFCSKHADLANADPILRWTWVAASNINLSIRTLYRGGLWLDQKTAHIVACCGLNFLKAYGHLVSLTLAADRDRFPVTPNFISCIIYFWSCKNLLHAAPGHCLFLEHRCNKTKLLWGYRAEQAEELDPGTLRCVFSSATWRTQQNT